MNDNKSSTEKKAIDLAAYETRKIKNGVVIKNVGVFQLKLRCEDDARTKGTINISGKTVPVLSNQHNTSSSKRVIGKDCCILLLDEEQSLFDYRIGILVDSVADIAKIAKDFI